MRIIYTLLLGFFANCTYTQDLYFPPLDSVTWETIAPSDLNFCQDSIDDLISFLEVEDTRSFILLREGKIVLEEYFGDFDKDSFWTWFSAGKSLRAMLIGIAQEKNLLNIDDKTSDYLGIGWTSLTQEREDSITIWHQMTMTSGLNPIDFTCVTPDCLTYLQSAGSIWAYHNGPYNLLKEVLENATNTPINQLTNNWIKTKIGMTSGFWLAAQNNTFFLSKARDMARFGLLVQNAGVWDSTIVLGDSSFMNNMLNTSQDLNPAYGYLWWLNGKSSFVAPGGSQQIPGMITPNAPTDVVTAAGSNGQFVSISPSNGYVMIRQGLSSSNDNAAIALLDNIWKRIINLDCSTTSVKSINQMQIDVYPNPFSDFIQINGLDEQFLEVSLLNSKGQLLQYFSNQSKLKIIDLPSGLFYLKIKYKGEETYRKVIRK